MCDTGKYANDAKTLCVPCTPADLAKVYPYADVTGYARAQWPWLVRLPLRSIRSPCTCDVGYMALSTDGGRCVACRPAQLSLALDLSLGEQAGAFLFRGIAYSLDEHPVAQRLCESCPLGSKSVTSAGDGRVSCQPCAAGKFQDEVDKLECKDCRTGTFANATGLLRCASCAKCAVGDYRSGCGSAPHDSAGVCVTCAVECDAGSMSTACINREGVAGRPPVCKRKELLTRTPLCQTDARDPTRVHRGLGLGGFDFGTVFGRSEDEVAFQCSRVCDSQGPDLGTVDTMTCDGPFACNRMACSMESSYLDTDLNEFRVGFACPVALSPAEEDNPMGHIDVVTRKRRAPCQKCSECGSQNALVDTLGLVDWGRGCAQECSMVLCAGSEIYDWTDHSCKTCARLANASLCAFDQTSSDALAVQDVSGYRAKILFHDCRAKHNEQGVGVSYGRCECCRAANQEQDCSGGAGLAQYHAGCVVGCQACLQKQDRVLTSGLKYVTMHGAREPLYCQLRDCETRAGRKQTGLKDLGAMCVRACAAVSCAPGEFELACTLPHDSRCRESHPRARVGQVVLRHVPAHANMLEHRDSAALHFSNFENVLVNVDALRDDDRHQCVWNAVDIRDNDMNPAGVSFTFFPPAKTYAFELSEYGSKFCHLWARNPRLQYPLLPLQNTVSFESAFPRRVLLNASARVMHYGYSGAGYLRVPDQRRLGRPAFRAVFTGDLYLSIDLLHTPNASLAVMVPDDRSLDAATWVPSFLFSCVLADATQRSAVARPALLARVTAPARTRRGAFAVSVVDAGPAETAAVQDFEGVHCEPALSRFAVPASHTGVALVSGNTVSGAATALSETYAEMGLAVRDVFGPGHHERVLAAQLPAGGVVSLLRSLPRSRDCHVLAVVGASLLCVDLRGPGLGAEIAFGAARVDEASRIVDVGAVGPYALVVLGLTAGDGQQVLAYHPETRRALEVDYAHDDIVAVACHTHGAAQTVWLLRLTVSESDKQFTLESTVLLAPEEDSMRLAALNDTVADLLGDVFINNAEISLSAADTYEMSVSETQSVFVLFALVEAGQRVLQIFHREQGRTGLACSLVSPYPGLDASFASSAWLSASRLVLHFQGSLYTASCEGGALQLRLAAGATLPARPFVQYGGSYVTLLDAGALGLYSQIQGQVADLARAEGFCVFVSAPRTTVTVHRLANAFLGPTRVVVDGAFDAERLVRYAQDRSVETVLSLQGLAADNMHVLVRLAPAPFAGVAQLAAGEQRREVHAVVPCAASLRVGGHTVSGDSAVCGALRVVVQLRAVEVAGAGQALRLELTSFAVFVKHEDGSVSQSKLSAATGTPAELRLFNGASITHALDVERFSSVLFPDDSLVPLAACESCEWQRLRYLVSGHALRPAQPLLVQVEREPESAEAWGEHRSVAVDALQLLVVLTTGPAGRNASRREGLAAAPRLHVSVYVPTPAELAQVDLAEVMHGSNDAYTDDWQRLFVLVGLEARRAAARMRGCRYRVRLAAVNDAEELLESPGASKLRELGCSLELGGDGIGECHVALPTALALHNSRRLVALTAEVVSANASSAGPEDERCMWPEHDLFTATLVPYAAMLACESEHFWSEDADKCVPCELADSDLAGNVCAPGQYIRGCDALSHLDHTLPGVCSACPNHNEPGSFEWLGGVCLWQCVPGFFRDTGGVCRACTSALEATCGLVAGRRWQRCSHTHNEACVGCAPISNGLYTSNEHFVPATPAQPAPCQTACKDGHFRSGLDNSCRVCSSLPNLQVQLDLVHGRNRSFFRFEACGGAQDTSARRCDPLGLAHGRYTGDAGVPGTPCPHSCEPGFHAFAGRCIGCDVPLDRGGTPLPLSAFDFTSEQCDYACRADSHFVLRNASNATNASCVRCDPAVCAVGSYLTGADCSECLPCAQMTLSGGVFTSPGALDGSTSCTEACPPGFFADFDRCLPHSAIVCDPGEYLLPGSGSMDAMCLPCASCHGQRLVQTCTPHSNSVCAACPPLRAHEVFTDAECSPACVPGALRDETGACEVCVTGCEPGAFRNLSGGPTCSQCTPCPPLPAHGNYTAECTWVCATGYTFSSTGACVPETPVQRRLAPEIERRIQCSSFEFLDSAYQCRSCSELEIQTPAPEGLGVRWRWKRWGQDTCSFECIGLFYQYSRADGTQFCYTETEYTAHVLLLNHQLSPVFLALPHRPDVSATEKDPAPAPPDRLSRNVAVLCAVFVVMVLSASVLL